MRQLSRVRLSSFRPFCPSNRPHRYAAATDSTSKFCLDHRTESAHSCSSAGSKAQADLAARLTSSPSPSPKSLQAQTCAESSCKTAVGTSTSTDQLCDTCRRRYCLKHRFSDSHNCADLQPAGLIPGSAAREKGLAAFEKLKAWGAAKKASLNIPQTRTQFDSVTRLKALSELKRSAKGDAKIPVSTRVHVYVEAQSDSVSSKIRDGRFFYSADASIGKVLDLAARDLQVQNSNNLGVADDQKLALFHVEGGRMLAFAEKLGTAVQTGNTIVLLRGMAPVQQDQTGLPT